VVERSAMVVAASSGTMIAPPTSRTAGWRPDCPCPADDSGRALVLDPFLGSGTVAQVAQEHGRRWIGFDLDARNASLVADRTRQTSLIGLRA